MITNNIQLYPYVLSYKNNFSSFNLELPSESKVVLYDCTHTNSSSFFEALRTLDKVSFGDQAMVMDKWVLYDCAAMPGAITGYCVKKNELGKITHESSFLNEFKIDSRSEFIPISMFIAIPMLESHSWFAHNLCSIGSRIGIKGLGLRTKELGINILNIRELYGATQWGSSAIHIHSQLADMRLVTSHTPNHTHQNSLTYKSSYGENFSSSKEKRICDDYDFLIAHNDHEKQKQLQQDILAGKEYYICGRPIVSDGLSHYPIKSK